MPPRSLPAFLRAARAALTAPAGQRPSPLTLVVGNESADLDSLCSTLLLAYFRSHTPPHYTLHVPLCHLQRADLDLRPELQAALASHGPGQASSSSPDEDVPTLDDLITLSELPDSLAAADTRWLLVDHNALTGDLAKRFAARVVGCIDHHVDEGVIPKTTADAAATADTPPRIIERCGSCASLVVDACRDGWRALAARQPDAAADRVLARLALAPVLVDTANLTAASKTEDVDRRAVAMAAAFWDGDRTRFYDTLMHFKNDISHWPYDALLRKDYKEWHETSSAGRTLALGMASVVQGLDYLLAHNGDRAALLAAVRAFARARRLDLVAVMTVQHGDGGGGFARQLVVWAFSADGARAAQAFAAANGDRLGLQPWTDAATGRPLFEGDGDDGEDGEWRMCWAQTRTECSRKQVGPFLREAMRSV